MQNEILSLQSETNGAPLDCRVVVELDLEGTQYVLLSPVRRLMAIVRDDQDGLEELAPGALEDGVLEAFQQKLAKHELAIEVVGDEFLLKGELTDDLAELCDSISVGDEEDDETHLILADHEHEKAQLLLLTPELPPLFPAKVLDGKAVPLSNEELEKVEERLAGALEHSEDH